MIGDPDQLYGLLRGAAHAVRPPTVSLGDELRALKTAADAISTAISERPGEFDQVHGYQAPAETVEGKASSTVVWARRELHLDAGETRQHLRAAATTMRTLPAVQSQARAGRLSGAHVNLFSFSLKHVGVEPTVALEPVLVDYAVVAAPGALKVKVDEFRDRVYPDRLDDKWIRGADRYAISLDKIGEGWHLNGFLPIDTGARFKTILDSLATPTEAGDTRGREERMLDGFDRLLQRILAEGMPTDGTIRPQVHVLVEAGTLKAALAPDPTSMFQPTTPATLVGFGRIGPALLRHLTTGADLTPVLVEKIEPNHTVLDVGRRHRYATDRQREAIWLQQNGICASRGCRNPIDHIHHETPWSLGGETNFDAMTGRCHRCHTHHHQHTKPPPRSATNSDEPPIPDRFDDGLVDSGLVKS